MNLSYICNEHNHLKIKLVFEGEYLNGKKQGKGKEYDVDIRIIK